MNLFTKPIRKVLLSLLLFLFSINTHAQYFTSPTRPASNIRFSILGAHSLEIRWNKGNGLYCLATIRKANAPQVNPKNGMATYNEDSNFGQGTDIGNGNFVIYNDFGTTLNTPIRQCIVFGLASNQEYVVSVYEFNVNPFLPPFKYFGAGVSATTPATLCPGIKPFDKAPWPSTSTSTPYQITAKIPFAGQLAQGNAYIYYGSDSKTLKKPILFVEGIDFGDNHYPDQNGDLGWCEFSTGGKYEKDYKALEKMPELIDLLHEQQYDIILLDFYDGADYMEKNAMLLVELINLVNNYKDPDGEPSVVVGASMGGQVARYALAYMEKHNMKHCTREYVSFDSPHKGANIPLGIQYYLDYYSNIDKKALQAKGFLNRPAPMELLVYHSNPVASGYRQGWTQRLTELGHPLNLRKVAIANGSGIGLKQLNRDGSTLEAGAPILLSGTNPALGGSVSISIEGDIYAQPGNLTFPDKIQNLLFRGNYDVHVPLVGDPNAHKTLPPTNKIGIGLFYDNAPGGYRNTAEVIAVGLSGNPLYPFPFTYSLYSSNQCFIPTISALDINTNDLFMNVNSALKQNRFLTPFDDYFVPQGSNQNHIELTDDNISWILEELKEGKDNLKSPLINQTFNYGRPQTKVLKSINVRSGGTLAINGNLKMDYLTGDVPEAKSQLNMVTSDCGSYVKVENGGTLQLGDNVTGNKAVLRITSGSTLHLTAGSKLVINDNSQLIVEEGANFIHERGAIIELAGSGALMDIQIAQTNTVINSGETYKISKGTAPRGGTFKILGGSFKLNSGSHMVMDGCTFVVGPQLNLAYMQNAEIQLLGTSAQLEFQGKLSIGNNANFTFTGMGFVKFNNTQPDGNKNITAGANASISFIGIGKNFKMLEINQETFDTPDNLKLLSLKNGSVTMGSNARLQADVPLLMDNVRMLPGNNLTTKHRGLHLFGQPGVTIQNSDFQDGKYGINAWLSYGGAPLKLTNCKFTNCEQGLFSHDKGVDMTNVTFEKCITGWYAEAMSFPSSGTLCTALENQAGISYNSSTGAALNLDKVLMQKNTGASTTSFSGGIEVNGSSKLTISCSNITGNKTGISLKNFAELDMSSYKVNDVSGNTNAITLQLGRPFNINEGSNNLISTGRLAIEGTILLRPGQKSLINALGNSWNSSKKVPQSWQDYAVLNLYDNTFVTLEDPNANGGGSCKDGPTLQNTTANNRTNPLIFCPSCTHIPLVSNLKLNEAVKLGLSKTTLVDPAANDNEAIGIFYNILKTPLKSPKPDEYQLRALTYSSMTTSLANSYKTGRNEIVLGETSLPVPVKQVIEVQDLLIEEAKTEGNPKQEFYITMDKSQTYRLAGQYNKAIKVIDEISHCMNLDSLQTIYKNQWRRFIMTESLVATGQIPKEDIEKYMEQNSGSYVSPSGISLKGNDTDTTQHDYAAGDTLKLNADEISESYIWSFGDCSTSTEKNPKHVFKSAGIYKVTLQQAFKCANITRVLFITVYPKPSPSFSITGPACAGTQGVTLTNTSASINTTAPACTTSSAYTPLTAANTRILYQWNINGAVSEDSIKTNITTEMNEGRNILVLKTIIQKKENGQWKNTSLSNTFTDSLNLSPALKTNFTLLPGSCTDTSFFKATVESGVAPFSYEWTLGNGVTSSGEETKVKYSSSGNYKVSLKTSDSKGCIDTISQLVTIGECATIKGTLKNTSGCPVNNISGLSIVLIDSTGSILQGISPVVSDSLGNFSFPLEQLLARKNVFSGFALQNAPGIVLATPGFSTIQQWIESSPLSLNLSTIPSQNDSSFSQLTTLSGDTLSFTTANSLNLHWDFGDCTTSDDSIVSHVYTSPGIYKVVLEKGGLCNYEKQIKEVKAFPKPEALFTRSYVNCSKTIDIENTSPSLQLNNTGCYSNFIPFTENNLRVLYEWSFGTGNLVSTLTRDAFHPQLNPGIQTLSLKASLQFKEGENWSATPYFSIFSDTVTISNPPVVTIENDTSFCLRDSVHFNASVSGGNTPLVYQWKFGETLVSTLAAPAIKFEVAATYTVSLLVTDNAGCTDTAKTIVTVPECPVSTVSERDASASWIDYNNDNNLDLFISRAGVKNALYQNNSGTLIKTSAGTLTADSSTFNRWGDYNNDGYTDVLTSKNGKNNLYRNNSGTFIPVTANTLVTDANTTINASWADYDNDGYLDLILINNAKPAALYHNNKNGNFTITPFDNTSTSFSTGCAWGDYDNDRFTDLFITVKGGNNLLYHNNGNGTFTKVNPGNIIENSKNVYAPQWIDFDNDGDLDLYFSNTSSPPYHVIYENNGSGFLPLNNSIAQEGIQGTSAWSDFDNDGDLDLLIISAFGSNNFFFENVPDNSGKPQFIQHPTDMVLTEPEAGQGAAVGDFNNDGYTDVFAAAAYKSGENYVFTNTNVCSSWLKVKCEGRISNRNAIGAKVSIKAMINGSAIWQTRYLDDASASIASFGVFEASQVDSLIVKWPASGLTQTYTQIDVNQTLLVIENTSIARIAKGNTKNTIQPIQVESQDITQPEFGIYPNPAHQGLTTLKFKMTNIDNVTVEVMDMTGKLIFKPIDNKEYPVGAQQLEVNIAGLANGFYYVRFSNSNNSAMKKLSIIH